MARRVFQGAPRARRQNDARQADEWVELTCRCPGAGQPEGLLANTSTIWLAGVCVDAQVPDGCGVVALTYSGFYDQVSLATKTS